MERTLAGKREWLQGGPRGIIVAIVACLALPAGIVGGGAAPTYAADGERVLGGAQSYVEGPQLGGRCAVQFAMRFGRKSVQYGPWLGCRLGGGVVGFIVDGNVHALHYSPHLTDPGASFDAVDDADQLYLGGGTALGLGFVARLFRFAPSGFPLGMDFYTRFFSAISLYAGPNFGWRHVDLQTGAESGLNFHVRFPRFWETEMALETFAGVVPVGWSHFAMARGSAYALDYGRVVRTGIALRADWGNDETLIAGLLLSASVQVDPFRGGRYEGLYLGGGASW